MVVAAKNLLVIEGTSDDTNGSLGAAFTELFKKKLKGKMPRIIMGESSSEAIRKYLFPPEQRQAHALIDLDGKGPDVEAGNYALLKQKRKETLGVKEHDKVYFMVQEMEAWFISQPKVLNEYYNDDIERKIPAKNSSKIEDPVAELRRIVATTKKKTYHKVKDGSRLIEKLDFQKLMNDFEDVNLLVKALES